MGLGRGAQGSRLTDVGREPARRSLREGQGSEARALGRIELDLLDSEHGHLMSIRFLRTDGGNPAAGGAIAQESTSRANGPEGFPTQLAPSPVEDHVEAGTAGRLESALGP